MSRSPVIWAGGVLVMAYLDRSFDVGGAAAVSDAATRLDAEARGVIAASHRDPIASLAAPGPAVRIVARLCGRRGLAPLSDPRLEALRRYVVLLRHGGDEWAAEAATAMVAAGYGVDQVAHARWLVAREGRESGPALPAPVMIILALFGLWIGVTTARATGEWFVGSAIGLLVVITAAPLLVPTRRRPTRATAAQCHFAVA